MLREFAADTAANSPVVLKNEKAAVEYRLREIEPFWRVFDAFVFDFTGVHGITAGFAEGLIGRLAEQHGEWVKDKLVFVQMHPQVEHLIAQILEENLRLYRHQPRA